MPRQGIVSIRPMTAMDVPVAQTLLSQLGYPLSLEEMRRRFEVVAGSGEHGLLVAEQAGRVVALCHVFARPALDKPPEAVVQALVVDTAARADGLGRTMMAAAEDWARTRGFTSVTLSSDGRRAEAHAFYEAIGYQHAATSRLFRRMLP